MVWFLSEVALDLALLGVIAAETPVENQWVTLMELVYILRWGRSAERIEGSNPSGDIDGETVIFTVRKIAVEWLRSKKLSYSGSLAEA